MKKKKSGITLLEMIIALAITVVIISITGSMFITGNKIFSDSDVKSSLQIEGQHIQERLSDIGMQAVEITSVSPLVIKSYEKGYDATPKYFKIEKSNENLIIDTDIDSSFSNNKKDEIISTNLKTLEVNLRNDGKALNFNIILAKKKGFSDVEHTIKLTVNLRNKSE